MRVLLDTCVLSELARVRSHARVRSKLQGLRSEDVFLSVITLGELNQGVVSREWLFVLERDYAQRILPIDAEVARLWGGLTTAARGRGETVSVSAGLIAATALQNGLTLWTRNVAAFRRTGVRLIDPWRET